MPSPSPTLLRQVFANSWVGGNGLNKRILKRTLVPMCSHSGSLSVRQLQLLSGNSGNYGCGSCCLCRFAELLLIHGDFLWWETPGGGKYFGWYCLCGQKNNSVPYSKRIKSEKWFVKACTFGDLLLHSPQGEYSGITWSNSQGLCTCGSLLFKGLTLYSRTVAKRSRSQNGLHIRCIK